MVRNEAAFGKSSQNRLRKEILQATTGLNDHYIYGGRASGHGAVIRTIPEKKWTVLAGTPETLASSPAGHHL